jgi:thymidylate synthase
MTFTTAEKAFEYYFDIITKYGSSFDNTKALFNEGFYIMNPLEREINTPFRSWNKNYAEYEWQWYLSADRSGEEISKKAPIWKNHMDENGNVNSNYGWQWIRGSQLDRIIDKLHFSIANLKDTRQAVISIYDGKEISEYAYDTPCTLSIHFQIINKRLCMTVNMRSNDLWYGFCNDQYCFSKLLELVAKQLEIEIGWYYHFASNIHLYNDQLKKDTNEVNE